MLPGDIVSSGQLLHLLQRTQLERGVAMKVNGWVIGGACALLVAVVTYAIFGRSGSEPVKKEAPPDKNPIVRSRVVKAQAELAATEGKEATAEEKLDLTRDLRSLKHEIKRTDTRAAAIDEKAEALQRQIDVEDGLAMPPTPGEKAVEEAKAEAKRAIEEARTEAKRAIEEATGKFKAAEDKLAAAGRERDNAIKAKDTAAALAEANGRVAAAQEERAKAAEKLAEAERADRLQVYGDLLKANARPPAPTSISVKLTPGTPATPAKPTTAPSPPKK